jgi:hypothetical protein
MSARPAASRVRASESPYTGHEGPSSRWRGLVLVPVPVEVCELESVVSVNGSDAPLCTSAVFRFTTHHAAPAPTAARITTAAPIRSMLRRRIRDTLAMRAWTSVRLGWSDGTRGLAPFGARPRFSGPTAYAVRSCGATTTRPVRSP